jgi:hypothetical protein
MAKIRGKSDEIFQPFQVYQARVIGDEKSPAFG